MHKCSGALLKPKGITNHSYKPYLFLPGSFLGVFFFYSYLVVSQFEIQLGEVLEILQLIY